MTVLVTGASGLIGYQVCALLAGQGEEVRALVRSRRAGPLDRLGVERVVAGLRAGPALIKAMSGCELVVHCAAIYSYDKGVDVSGVNVDGTREIIAAAAEAGVPRIVVTSSSVTCGSSDGPFPRDETGRIGAEYTPAYFTSKVQQERVALEVGRRHGVEVVIACPTVVLGGPSSRLVPSNAIVLRYLLDPTRSTFPGGCNVVSARDVAAGLVRLGRKGVAGERYLLGGDDMSWRSLHAMIGDLAGVGGPYAELPGPAAVVASAAAEMVARVRGGESLSTREEARTIGRYYWYSSDKAAALGYSAGPGRAAVAESLAWMLAGTDVPRVVREGLRVADGVRRARPLVPRPL